VGLLHNLESRLDKIVNGSFSKAFKSAVEPVELAAGLQQELDLRADFSTGQSIVPNIFIFDLGPEDYERLTPYFANLSAELATVANKYGIDQRYTFQGNINITFDLDVTLETGVFRIRSEAGKAQAQPVVVPNPELTPQVPIAEMVNTDTPRLLAVDGTEYKLTQSITTLGRGETADIQIADSGASRNHCQVILGAPCLVRDLGSTNGTTVDGAKISEAELHDGSIIKIGGVTLTFKSR
jgi:hypothetical protein